MAYSKWWLNKPYWLFNRALARLPRPPLFWKAVPAPICGAAAPGRRTRAMVEDAQAATRPRACAEGELNATE